MRARRGFWRRRRRRGREKKRKGQGVVGMREAGQPLGSQSAWPSLILLSLPACVPSLCLPPCSLTPLPPLPPTRSICVAPRTPPHSLSAPGSQASHVVRARISLHSEWVSSPDAMEGELGLGLGAMHGWVCVQFVSLVCRLWGAAHCRSSVWWRRGCV